LEFLFAEGNDHVLWFEIRVDDATLAMQVIEADEDLLCHSSYKRQWNTLVVVSLHDFKQVDTEDLEHHDEVLSVWPRVDK